jgi:dihydroorotate dehydrogenase (fumarate)
MNYPAGVDLTTNYLGIRLSSPVVVSAGPWGRDLHTIASLADAGAGAIVLPSLFEEEIVAEEVGLSRALEAGSDNFAEALGYFPATPAYTSAADRYLELLRQAKKDVDVPIIASLNATSIGGWARYAKLLAEAGADAIELNVYRVPTDPQMTAAQVEQLDLVLVGSVCASVPVPVAVKLSPYYSSLAHFAARVVSAGAAGLVLFNRFYQPDLDLETMDVVPKVELSGAWELRLPLRWIAILRPQLGAGPSLAASSGAHSGTDVVKAIAVGADVAMMTSAILHYGSDHIRTVESQLAEWLAEHGYGSVAELRGAVSQTASADAGAFERANYLKTLHSWATVQ